MGKPWSKLEIDYMDHPKFSVLSASAICLWHSAKNYCDKWHTDGLIPAREMKHFRFYAPKFLSELTHTAGQKVDGTDYAPLLEVHPVGFKMHDYLDHNDCREEVLARLEDADDRAELRQTDNRKRQAAHRARRKVELETSRRNAESHVTSNADSNANSNAEKPLRTQNASRPTEAVSVSEAVSEREEKREDRPPLRPQPIIRKRRLDAAFEGARVYVPQRVHSDFVALRGGESALLAWYETVSEEWFSGARKDDEPGSDMIRFWKARYDEKWPATGPAKPKSRWADWQPKPAVPR